MPKDFAARHGSSKKSTRSKPKTRRANPQRRVLFHGPSFSFGALAGAAAVILAAYAPELLERQQQDQAETPPAEPKQDMVYVFPELLPKAEVKADPTPYQPDPVPTPEAAPSYIIQAASFRSRADADELRAQLILDGLEATVDAKMVNQQRWHRVVVGPYQRPVEANRAMTKLRQMSLTPIRLSYQN